jgi:hypothetical protein
VTEDGGPYGDEHVRISASYVSENNEIRENFTPRMVTAEIADKAP